MATYPIKMLRDEDRQAFVPFTNAAAVVDKDNNSLQELMDNGKYKIQNNVTTASAGKGVLDAYQGKVLNDKFNNYVPLSQKGVANGVASLDSEGKVPSAQLPSYVDDVIESYIVSGSTALSSGWLSKTEGGAALTPEKGKIYLVMTSGSHQNKQYRWGGSTYVLCNPSDVNSVNGMTGVVTLKTLTLKTAAGKANIVNETFNAGTDKTVTINVPTKTSHITNDSGFITSSASITGNAATATKATQDSAGNVIIDTYVKKSGDTLTGPLQYKTANYTSTPITIKDDGTSYGHTLIIGAGGATIISAGESGSALSTELGTTSAETLYMIADGNLYLYSNANTIGDKKGAILTTGGHFHPLTNNAQTLGSTSNKWSNVYATTFTGNLTGNVTGNVNGHAIEGAVYAPVVITKSLTVGTDWMDSGITYADVGATGSYMVQLTGANNGQGGLWGEVFTGVMTVYSGGTNSGASDEILLQNSGHAPNSGDLFLRVLRTGREEDGSCKLQIASKIAFTAAQNMKFTFRRII